MTLAHLFLTGNRQVFFYKLLAESYLASAGASWIAETSEQKRQAVNKSIDKHETEVPFSIVKPPAGCTLIFLFGKFSFQCS